MSWYTAEWAQRRIINHRNPLAAATIDVAAVIPEDDDEFWEKIDNSGFELRVCAADGITLLSYEVDDGSGGAFDKAGRNGRILVDGLPVAANDNHFLIFVYFDSGSSPQGDASVATTIASPIDGFIDLGSPAWADIVMETQRIGITEPHHQLSMAPDDEFHLWVDLTPFFEERADSYAGKDIFEEPYFLELLAVDDAEADATATVFLEDQIRFVEVCEPGSPKRQIFVRIGIGGLVAGTNYTLRPHVKTVYPTVSVDLFRKQQITVGIECLDPLLPAP